MGAAPKIQVFNPAETAEIDENVELGQESPASPGEATPVSPEEAPAQEPPAEQPPPAEETRADKRIRQLLAERQAAVQERDQLREQWARLDERTKQVKEAREAAERAQQQQQIDEKRAIDPVGAELDATKQQLQELLAWKQQQEQNFQQLQQGIQVDRQQQDFNNWVVAEAQSYSRQQPDYADAARHAAEWRIQWWQELGLPPDQARQMVIHESNLLAQISRQSGKPFAPVIYKLAQSVGYRPAGNLNGNGNTGAAPAAAVTNAAKLLQAQRGQAMQGLSRVPSAGTESKTDYRNYTAADLARMSEAEFARAKADPKAWADLQYAMAREDGLLEYEDINYNGRGGR
jgi:hypothetical protein